MSLSMTCTFLTILLLENDLVNYFYCQLLIVALWFIYKLSDIQKLFNNMENCTHKSVQKLAKICERIKIIIIGKVKYSR